MPVADHQIQYRHVDPLAFDQFRRRFEGMRHQHARRPEAHDHVLCVDGDERIVFEDEDCSSFQG